MEYVILAGVIIAAIVIGVDVARQRRLARDRIDLPRILQDRSAAGPGGVDVGSLLAERASLREPGGERAEGADDEQDEGDEDAPLEGVWTTVDHELDPGWLRPKLAEGTELVDFRLRWGNDYGMIASPNRAMHFTLEIWEVELVRQMDGSKTLAELVVDRLERDGGLDAGAVVGLVESLRRAGMLDPAPTDVGSLVKERLDTSTGGRRKLREFLKTMRLSYRNTDALIRRLYDGGFHVFYTKSAVVIGLVVAVTGVAAYLSVVLSGRFHLTIGNPPLQTLILMVLGFLLTAAHELGHAMTLVHFGRRIGSSGFLIYYGSPAFFVESSDGLMLSAPKRIVQAAAGPLAETMLAGISSILLFTFPESSFAPFLFKFSFLNYYVILMNLIPLLELDGYWIMCDAIEVQDLRPRSLAFIQRDMWRKIRRRERFSPQEVGLGIYGIVGLAFTIFSLLVGLYFWRRVFGQLLLDLWNMGTGPRLLMVLLVLFLAGPAIRGLLTAARAIGRRIRALWRRIRFRLETSWRVEAASMIDGLPAFDDLPVDVLNDLAGRVRLRTVPPGQAVFFRGDQADAFFIIRRGRVAVEDVEADTGDTRVLTTLARGDSFGELGLLQRAPRQTTIRAIDDVELFEVDRPTFDRLLAKAIDVPDFAPTMQSFAELKELPAFRTLTFEELADLLQHGGWITVAPGDVLIEQGAVGDAFYAIRSGQVEVVRDGETLASLGPGEHFGEIALLEDVPRTASVITATPARIFRLDREGFDAVVAESFRRGSLKRATDRTAQH